MDFKDKAIRNWYTIVLAVVLLGYFGDKAVWKTSAVFIGLMALMVFAANIALHSFTSIEWRDWREDSESAKLGKCIVMAGVIIAVALVATAVFGNFGIHTTDQVLPGVGQ